MFARFLARSAGLYLLCSAPPPEGDAPGGGGAPPAPPAPPPAPAGGAPPAPPAPAANAVEPPPDQRPAWLTNLLDRTRDKATKSLLTELGIDASTDPAKAAEVIRNWQNSQKDEKTRLKEQVDALAPKATKLTEYEAEFAELARVEMAKLTDDQRAAVTAIAGDNPLGQVRAIRTLRPTWTAAPPAPPAPPGQRPPAPPLRPPANTGTPPSAPNPANVSQPDHLAVYESLQAANPMKASRYYERFRTQIVAAQTAKQVPA